MDFVGFLLRLVFGLFGLSGGAFGLLLRLLRDLQQFLHAFALFGRKDAGGNGAGSFVKKLLPGLIKWFKRRQFQHAVQIAVVNQRQGVGIKRRFRGCAGADQGVGPGNVLEQDRGFFQRDLADDAFSEPILRGRPVAFGKGERTVKRQHLLLLVVHVDDAIAGLDIMRDKPHGFVADF